MILADGTVINGITDDAGETMLATTTESLPLKVFWDTEFDDGNTENHIEDGGC